VKGKKKEVLVPGFLGWLFYPRGLFGGGKKTLALPIDWGPKNGDLGKEG